MRPRRSSGHVTPGFRGRGRGPKRGRTWPRGPGIPTPGFDRALRRRGSECWTPGAVPAGRRRGTPSEGPLLAEFPDLRLESLRVDLALQESAKARAPMFDQDSFPGIEDHGCLALLEMILISELLREGDLAFRADCRRLRHRPMIGLSGIISLLQVKKYCSESLFLGHTETQGHRFA